MSIYNTTSKRRVLTSFVYKHITKIILIIIIIRWKWLNHKFRKDTCQLGLNEKHTRQIFEMHQVTNNVPVVRNESINGNFGHSSEATQWQKGMKSLHYCSVCMVQFLKGVIGNSIIHHIVKIWFFKKLHIGMFKNYKIQNGHFSTLFK